MTRYHPARSQRVSDGLLRSLYGMPGIETDGGAPAQVEVFYELNAKAMLELPKLEEGGSPGPKAVSSISSQEDRFFLFAVLLHCADISNSWKPMSITDKCVTLSPSCRPAPPA